MKEQIKDFLYFFKVPIVLIIGFTIFILSIVALVTPKEDLAVSIIPEQELEQRKIIECNQKWFDGYKQGQIDAIKGYINFELKKNDNGETLWEHSPKRGYNK